MGSGFKVQPSRWPPKRPCRSGHAEAASLIEKETNERRTSNVEHPTSNTVFCQFKKILSQVNLTIEIRHGRVLHSHRMF
jgi:hypothetical protein